MKLSLVKVVFCLILLGSIGCTLEKLHLDNSCTANFDIENNNCSAICEVSFTNKTKNATAFQWDFGDGNTSTEANPKNVFNAAGNYRVKLVAQCEMGTTEIEKEVNISIPTFEKNLGEGRGYSVIETSDGRLVWAGYVSIGNQEKDAVLSKMDNIGSEIWRKTFNENEEDIAFAVKEELNEDLVLTGKSVSNGNSDFLLIQTLADGNLKGRATYGDELNEEARDIILVSDNQYVFVGTEDLCRFPPCNHLGFFIADILNDGQKDSINPIGIKDAYGSGNNTLGFSGIKDGNSFVAVGNEFENSSSDKLDVYLIKSSFDNFDNIKTKKIEESGNQTARDIILLNDGTYLIVGSTENESEDIYWIKTDKEFSILNSGTIGGVGSDRANAIAATKDGGFIITGETNSTTPGNDLDVYLVKVGQNFNVEWENTFGGTFVESGQDVVATSDGGYLVIGYIQNGSSSNIYLIKTDGEGQVR